MYKVTDKTISVNITTITITINTRFMANESECVVVISLKAVIKLLNTVIKTWYVGQHII